MSAWCTIESDPGVFTELISRIGTRGVQVEELYDLSDDSFKNLMPVYGLIFLFKYGKEIVKSPKVVSSSSVKDMFSANQVINNACATQAIVSVLLNRKEIQIGEILSDFTKFTKDLPPNMKGLALSNSSQIREAHNSFARPEPFQVESLSNANSEDDAFHFVSYIPFDGGLYELDGLQSGPIFHGVATEENWLQKVRPILQTRMGEAQKDGKGEIRFNLLALIRNLQERYVEEVKIEEQRKQDMENRLNNSGASAMDVDGLDSDGLRQEIVQCESKIEDLNSKITAEQDKFKKWKEENIRRKHNYIPFIFNLLKKLAEKGMLPALIEAAEAKKNERKAKETIAVI